VRHQEESAARFYYVLIVDELEPNPLDRAVWRAKQSEDFPQLRIIHMVHGKRGDGPIDLPRFLTPLLRCPRLARTSRHQCPFPKNVLIES
jgi:hypothetical protein